MMEPVGVELSDQEAYPRALARACGCDSYEALLEAFAAARHKVAQAWKQILGTDILATEQENPA